MWHRRPACVLIRELHFGLQLNLPTVFGRSVNLRLVVALVHKGAQHPESTSVAASDWKDFESKALIRPVDPSSHSLHEFSEHDSPFPALPFAIGQANFHLAPIMPLQPCEKEILRSDCRATIRIDDLEYHAFETPTFRQCLYTTNE